MRNPRCGNPRPEERQGRSPLAWCGRSPRCRKACRGAGQVIARLDDSEARARVAQQQALLADAKRAPGAGEKEPGQQRRPAQAELHRPERLRHHLEHASTWPRPRRVGARPAGAGAHRAERHRHPRADRRRGQQAPRAGRREAVAGQPGVLHRRPEAADAGRPGAGVRHPAHQGRPGSAVQGRRLRRARLSPARSCASTRPPRPARARCWSTSASTTRTARCAPACSPRAHRHDRVRPRIRCCRWRRAPGQGRDVVYRVDGGKVVAQPVKLGLRNEDEGWSKRRRHRRPAPSCCPQAGRRLKPGAKVKLPVAASGQAKAAKKG
jgi:hypothetical protein